MLDKFLDVLGVDLYPAQIQALRDSEAETTARHYAHVSTQTLGDFNQPVDNRNRHERRRDRALAPRRLRAERLARERAFAAANKWFS